jgi:hypothetical protein
MFFFFFKLENIKFNAKIICVHYSIFKNSPLFYFIENWKMSRLFFLSFHSLLIYKVIWLAKQERLYSPCCLRNFKCILKEIFTLNIFSKLFNSASFLFCFSAALLSPLSPYSLLLTPLERRGVAKHEWGESKNERKVGNREQGRIVCL